MDDLLKSDPTMLNATLTVRRVTAISASGGSETLGSAVVLDAYREQSTSQRPAAGTGLGGAPSERRTDHFFVVDYDEVVTKLGSGLKDSDRFWIDGADSSNMTFSLKAKALELLNDPETGAPSHYEVTL